MGRGKRKWAEVRDSAHIPRQFAPGLERGHTRAHADRERRQASCGNVNGLDLTRCQPAVAEPHRSASARYGVGDVIASKYRLESLLGEGGMGSVWRAVNLQLEAPVAIKVIRGEVERELLTMRLVQEARAAAKLGHPAIVRIFDVGESELGDPFIVMELLSGRSLGNLIANDGCLSATQAVQLLLPVADALSVAHAKGIVHRDLKPDNVFIAVDNERIQPKLVDFGIVKMSDLNQKSSAPIPSSDSDVKKGTLTRLTQHGTVVGSPQYMSPEQARGREDLDHRTDIWSFCVVLYEAISAQLPFRDQTYNALLLGIQEDEPLPPDSLRAEDAGLWAIIQHGLAKEPAARFQSMTELGQALSSWLVSQGVFEDACGVSLGAHTGERISRRGGRASFDSAGALTPKSGMRALNLEFVAAPTPNSQQVAVAGDAATRNPRSQWFRLPRLLLLAGVLCVALVLGLAARQARVTHLASEAAPAQAAAKPTLAVAPAASAASLPPAGVVSLESIPLETSASAPSTHSAEAATSGPQNKTNFGPRRAVSKRITAPPAGPTPAPQPMPPQPNRASRDLMSPY
jgi:eukaryotic-like serine/threonine-protein kinase